MNEPVEAAVLRVLREADEPLTGNAVAAQIPKRRSDVLRALQALEAEGVVEDIRERPDAQRRFRTGSPSALWIARDADRQFVGSYWRRKPRREASS